MEFLSFVKNASRDSGSEHVHQDFYLRMVELAEWRRRIGGWQCLSQWLAEIFLCSWEAFQISKSSVQFEGKKKGAVASLRQRLGRSSWNSSCLSAEPISPPHIPAWSIQPIWKSNRPGATNTMLQSFSRSLQPSNHPAYKFERAKYLWRNQTFLPVTLSPCLSITMFALRLFKPKTLNPRNGRSTWVWHARRCILCFKWSRSLESKVSSNRSIRWTHWWWWRYQHSTYIHSYNYLIYFKKKNRNVATNTLLLLKKNLVAPWQQRVLLRMQTPAPMHTNGKGPIDHEEQDCETQEDVHGRETSCFCSAKVQLNICISNDLKYKKIHIWKVSLNFPR